MHPTAQPVSRHPMRHSRTLPGALTFLFALCVALTACGVTQPQVASGIPGTPAASPSPTATSPATATPSTATGPSCGSVTIGIGGGTSLSKPSDAVPCFVNAYAACSAATLAVTQFTIDSGVTHSLTLGAGCTLTDDAQHYTAQGSPPTGPSQHYTCGKLSPINGGFVINDCGTEGDIFVPPPAPTS